ncbi:hemerythrin domain-containing protein [Burkholderia stagnalis]|uniref:Universal stress protein n=1 Tax=Burkholderia stagnalis TaxID=1503054 RepID=A0A106P5Y3_9BURK|nr:hemerythrin domain-containing protein [Burkholderia stagnalis]KVZ18831.1 universal stress protein [Burkholderia stagnalis]KWA46177.1 universal stress protein [Burkholderia stagnalis]KWA52596.1 universal stress protein [Burkholderia stagnalis]KWA62191.1 universal stress protein [Burkholderia stagnalis]KWC90919.1 universal stress protein [Burkholderia stagnalis]
MYRHLLVTVECAPGGIDAVGHALELARAIGARITFVLAGAAPGPYLPGAQAAEQGAKVEAAARAQGVSHAIAPADGATLDELAGRHGCDLICVAALPGSADAAAGARRRDLLATSAVPVLVCAASKPAAARVIARCLDAHRAVAALLHALMRAGAATGEPEQRAAAVRRVLADLAGKQRPDRGDVTEAQLFAMLRARTECVAAELDELARQQRRDARALDALAGMAEDVPPQAGAAAFDAALARYARGVFEQMGRKEGVIFPAARRYLGDADWAALDAGPPADMNTNTNETDDARRASD